MNAPAGTPIFLFADGPTPIIPSPDASPEAKCLDDLAERERSIILALRAPSPPDVEPELIAEVIRPMAQAMGLTADAGRSVDDPWLSSEERFLIAVLAALCGGRPSEAERLIKARAI